MDKARRAYLQARFPIASARSARTYVEGLREPLDDAALARLPAWLRRYYRPAPAGGGHALTEEWHRMVAGKEGEGS